MNTRDIAIDFERSLGPWIGRTSKMVDHYIQESLDDHGLELTKEQMVVLKKVHDEDGLSQNELALLTFRDKSSLARLLVKMENKGYLYRRHNAEDKRINEVFLTPLGRQIFQECKLVIREILHTLEQNISKSEIEETIRVLKQVQQNFMAGRLKS